MFGNTPKAVAGAVMFVGGWLSVFSFASRPAWGQTPPADVFVPLLGLVALIALILFVTVILLLKSLRRARRTVEALEEDLARIEAIDAAGPCAYIAWPIGTEGREFTSPGLHSVLGISPNVTVSLESLRLYFSGAGADRVMDAIGALATTGQPFTMEARTEADRSYRLTGSRIEECGVDAIWIQDETVEIAGAERLAAEAEELAIEAERLRGVLDTLPLPVWRRARDLTLTYCNRAYAEAVNAESPAAALLDEREIGAGAVGGRGQALAERARKSGSAQSESHHLVIGGARRLLEFNEVPLREDPGLLAGHALDFTSMENVQAELGRHIEAHAEVLELLGSGISTFGPDRRLKFFNRSYAHLWRLEPEWLNTEPEFGEILEILREQRMLPEVIDFRVFKNSRLALFNSVLEPQEEYLHLPDERTIRQIIAPHPLGGLLFLHEDVTDRLALERSYNTLIAVQRETLNELTESVSVFGSDGRLKLYNPAYLRLWGFQPADVVGQPHVAELVERSRHLYPSDEPWPEQKSKVVGRIMQRSPSAGRLSRTDGRVVDYATVPLPDGSVLHRENDVTDTYNVERALTERNAALQEADRLKTEFLANVSYELRTPLNTIIGFAEILSNGYFGALNRRQTEYCSGILEASQRLLGLINDILDLSMVEAGQIALDIDRIDVRSILSTVLNLARERANVQNVRLVTDCPADIGEIMADDRRMKQVLFNLVNNAIKFTPAGGEVAITVRRSDEHLEIQVSDTGVGIAEDDLDRVFGAFAHARTGERPAGAGLGLTLVKRFIEMHGGTVVLASRPGEGTHVTLRLPVDGGGIGAAADSAPSLAARGAD